MQCAASTLWFFWTEEEFVSLALKAEHPLSAEQAVPGPLRDVVEMHLKLQAYELAFLRVKYLAKWAKRAKELIPEEIALKASMEPSVARAVKNKRILLFKEMLLESSYPDLGVGDELVHGSDLVGSVPATGMLPGKFTPALTTPDTLRANAQRIRAVVESDSRGSGDPDVDKEVWKKTMEEVEKGWLEGPLSSGQVPSCQPISRRFGLVQKKGKLRLIDDYTESGVNACVNVCEAPILHTIDVACAMLVLWFSACGLCGAASNLVVRTFDLKSAYRQVGLSRSGRDFACLRVFDPSVGRVRFFRSNVLPFGAIRSVHSFLRLSRAIWWLGAVGCRLLWTSF